MSEVPVSPARAPAWLAVVTFPFKVRVVLLEAAFCAIPAVMTWYLVLGADPRADGEWRHAWAIGAAVLVVLVAGVGLLITGRFRPSPWLYVRAAQIAAGVALVQLALVQPHVAVLVPLAALGSLVLGAGLYAVGRVLLHRTPVPWLDVALVHGSLATALVVAGCHHSRELNCEFAYVDGIGTATLETAHWFGLIRTDTERVTNVARWERGFVIDGGHGIELVAYDGSLLLVPGEESVPGTIVEQLSEVVDDMTRTRDGTFAARESHFYIAVIYLLIAIVLLYFGYHHDILARHHTLVPIDRPDDGTPASADQDDSPDEE